VVDVTLTCCEGCRQSSTSYSRQKEVSSPSLYHFFVWITGRCIHDAGSLALAAAISQAGISFLTTYLGSLAALPHCNMSTSHNLADDFTILLPARRLRRDRFIGYNVTDANRSSALH